MIPEASSTINLLDTVSHRQIAQIAYSVLTRPLDKFNPLVRESYENQLTAGGIGTTERAEMVENWWRVFKDKYNVPDGNLMRGDEYEILRKEYGATISEEIQKTHGSLQPRELARLWFIAESNGGSGINIRSAQRDEMIVASFETLIAYRLTLKATDAQTAQTIKHIDSMIEYAALRVRDCEKQHVQTYIDMYNGKRPHVILPESVPDKRRRVFDHVQDLIRDKQAELARISAETRAKELWRRVGIKMPNAIFSYEMDPDAPKINHYVWL